MTSGLVRVVSARLGARGPAALLVMLSLAVTGCGALIAVLGALATAAITDALSGSSSHHHHGAPTVLVVVNDGTSLDTIVEVDVAPVTGTEPPSSHVVGVTPGAAATFSDVFDSGLHSVRVVYSAGWRSRARIVNIVANTTTIATFLHPAPDLGAVQGSWFGAVEKAGVGHTYAMTLDGTGDASSRTLDGVVSPATGAYEETSEGVYRVTWIDGRVDALVADTVGGATHVAVVSDDHTMGVLQKGASPPLTAAVNGDVVGSWSGVQVRFSGLTLIPIDVDSATAAVNGSNAWSGRDGTGNASVSTTPLLVSDAAFLRFFASAVDGALALDLAVGLSPDRDVLEAAITPSAGGTFPDDTLFQLLTKGP